MTNKKWLCLSLLQLHSSLCSQWSSNFAVLICCRGCVPQWENCLSSTQGRRENNAEWNGAYSGQVIWKGAWECYCFHVAFVFFTGFVQFKAINNLLGGKKMSIIFSLFCSRWKCCRLIRKEWKIETGDGIKLLSGGEWQMHSLQN